MYNSSDRHTLTVFSPELFSINLKHIMEGRGFTQDELSYATSISRQSLSKYMTGKVLPRLETIARLAYVLDVSIYDLIDPSIEFSYDLDNEYHPIPPSISMKTDEWVDIDGLTKPQQTILLELIEEFRKLNHLPRKIDS